MMRLKALWVSYILPLIGVFAIVAACGTAGNNQMRLCKHQYALCTSAICIPQPGDPSKAICFCDVHDGKSMSTTPCDKLKPSTDPNGIRTVYSTFSYEQFNEGKKVMKCPGNTPWTWCLNKRCTVNPSDPSKAVCVCDVMRTPDEWITFGGSCDPTTCETGYWSGAAMKDFNDGNVFMTRKLRLDQSPVKWCGAQ